MEGKGEGEKKEGKEEVPKSLQNCRRGHPLRVCVSLLILI